MGVKDKKYDLTTGGILQKLMVISIPVMASQLMQMAYNLTDMFWLGRVGSDAVAASGTAGLFMWLSAGFMMLGRIGCEVGVSQSLGKSEKSAAVKYAQNSMFLAIIAGVLYALFLIISRTGLVGFFNIQESNVVSDAEWYLSIIALSVPMTYLTSAISGTFNACGNSKVPFYLNCCGLVMNMILDPIVILALDMGVIGAAMATVVAQTFVFILHVIAVKYSKSRPFDSFKLFARPSGDKIKQILRWAVPVSVESLLFCMLTMVTSRFEASFGYHAIAVSRVGSQVESLSWLVGGGFSSALIAYVGQNYGARKWSRIQKGFNLSMKLMTVWGIIVAALFVFFGGALFSFFLPEPELYNDGLAYMRILAAAQVGMCVEAVVGGTFKGMGKSVPPAVVSVSVNAMRVVGAYLLSQTGLGLYGIWIAISISSIVKGGWALLWYLRSERKRKRIEQDGIGSEQADNI